MRLYPLVFATYAAILTCFTNSSEASVPALTETSLLASGRSSDEGRDAVPTGRMSTAQEIMTGEKRVYAELKTAVTKLLTAVHEHNPRFLELSPAERASQKIADRKAIEYYIVTLKGKPKELLEKLHSQVQVAKTSPGGISDIVEAARAHWKRLKEKREVFDEQMMEQVEWHPDRLIWMANNAAKVNEVRLKRKPETPYARPNLLDLKTYIEKYNAKKGTALTLQGMLLEFFGDISEYAAFLSRAHMDPKNKDEVQNMLTDLFEGWLVNAKAIKDAANILKIPMHGEEVLGHPNVDILVRYINALVEQYPDDDYNRVWVEHLSRLFGNRQAAVMIEKLCKVSQDASNKLMGLMFERLTALGVSSNELRLEIVEAKPTRTSDVRLEYGILQRYITFCRQPK